MLVAIVATKIPVLLGHGFGPFGVRDTPFYGFLSMAHEMRTDWTILLGSLFLLSVGAGPWSLDKLLRNSKGALHSHRAPERADGSAAGAPAARCLTSAHWRSASSSWPRSAS